jgi:hypothetical protein
MNLRSEKKKYQIFGLTLETDFPFRTPLVPATGRGNLFFSVVASFPGHFFRKRGEVLYESTLKDKRNCPVYVLTRHDESYVLEAGGAISFLLHGNRILCRPTDSKDLFVVENLFLGVTLALYLEMSGFPVFHGSVVGIEGRAVAFLSPSGGGRALSPQDSWREEVHSSRTTSSSLIEPETGLLHFRVTHP